MSDIERELVKAARLRKQEDQYKNRQDYMADIVRHFDKICAKDDSAVDSVSEEAYTWYEDAATAINSKDRIPEFPDVQLAQEVEDEPEEEVEDRSMEVEEAEPEEEVEEEVEIEDEPEPEVAPKKVVKAKAKPKAKRPKKKLKREGVELNEEGVKDKYGVVVGTIRHEVLKFFEKGASQAECKKEYGQTYYNLLKQMSLEGHLVERTGPGIFKLTHKDEVTK